MDKINSVNLVYETFTKNYKDKDNPHRNYRRSLRDKNNIVRISFSRLSVLYIIISIIIIVSKFVLPKETFGGFTYKKLFSILAIIFLCFFIIFVYSINNIPGDQYINYANNVMYDTLKDLTILDSKNKIMIIDHLIENKDYVGSYYVKLFNVLKNSKIKKFFSWLGVTFLTFYLGLISGILLKLIDTSDQFDPYALAFILGKFIVQLLLYISIISVLYFIVINFFYKDETRVYDLYVLSLKNIKYDLLLKDEEAESGYNTVVEESANTTKVKSHDVENKQRPKVNKNSIILTVSVIYSILAVIYIFAYSNFIETMTNKSK